MTLHGSQLLVNQLELVSTTTVAGTLYGIAFALFCLYVHSMVPRLRDDDRKRLAKFMLAYSAVIMLFGLCYLVINAWVAQEAVIKHSDYPLGPYYYILTIYNEPSVIMGLTCQLAVDVLTSAIQIWRVWIIWNATRHAKLVIVLPSLCFLTFTALKLRTLILETTLPYADDRRLDANAQKAEDAIQGATTILCTLLISGFLCFQHLRQRKLIGKTNRPAGYMGIIAMLIESYALESIWILIVAVLDQDVVTFFGETRAYIEILAYLLVQYRVASQKAYESQRGRSHISSLNWNHSDHATTQSGVTSDAAHDPHVSVKPEALEVIPGNDHQV